MLSSDNKETTTTAASTTAPLPADDDNNDDEDKQNSKDDKTEETKKPVTTPTTTTTTTTTATTPAPAVPDNTQAAVGEIIPGVVLYDSPVGCTETEAEAFRLINDIRLQNGLTPFKWDLNAYNAAKIRVNEITNNFSHKRPDGSKFSTAYSTEIYNSIKKLGENIAAGQKTSEKVVSDWMNSDSHRKNILDPEFTGMAIAFCHNDNAEYKNYWSQHFTTYFN